MENTPNTTPVSPVITYGKLIVAVLGTAVTTLLGLIPPHTTLWIVLTVLAAVVTSLGVYAAPAITVASKRV